MKLSGTFSVSTLLLWTSVLHSFHWNGLRRSISQARSPQNQRRAAAFGPSTPRKACGLYLWDAPSALLFQWCRHLQKTCTYEGRGGSRFVRVRPGSMLQLLHPCNRYSPDKCIICGGCYKDHLILGWVKHLYKPFDRLLDKDYEESLVPTIGTSHNKKTLDNVVEMRRHAFHRRYVLDISQKIIDKKCKRLPYRARGRVLQQEFTERFGISRGPPVAVVASSGALYLPDRSPEGKRPSLLIGLCRLLVLDSVKNMYRLQLRDNAKASAAMAD